MTTAERGYGYAHVKLREQWRARVEAGVVRCAHPQCGRMILPGEAWDLGHDPADRSRHVGPMHARCNRNTAVERRLHGRVKRGFRWRSPEWGL